jgi:hypothetical protein
MHHSSLFLLAFSWTAVLSFPYPDHTPETQIKPGPCRLVAGFLMDPPRAIEPIYVKEYRKFPSDLNNSTSCECKRILWNAGVRAPSLYTQAEIIPHSYIVTLKAFASETTTRDILNQDVMKGVKVKYLYQKKSAPGFATEETSYEQACSLYKHHMVCQGHDCMAKR